MIMTTRTVNITGYGFGASPAQITVTVDGVTVFNGAVTTADQPVPSMPNPSIENDPVVLASFDVDVAYAGTKAVTCSVTNGTLVFADLTANYTKTVNTAYTDEQRQALANCTTAAQSYAIYSAVATPAFSAEEQAELLLGRNGNAVLQQQILDSHHAGLNIANGTTFATFGYLDPRSNITIDGVTQPAPSDPTETGNWWYVVPNGSVLAYDLAIPAGEIIG